MYPQLPPLRIMQTGGNHGIHRPVGRMLLQSKGVPAGAREPQHILAAWIFESPAGLRVIQGALAPLPL